MSTYWECLVHCVFVSIVTCILIGNVLQIAYSSHDITGTHVECHVNRLFVFMTSRVLIGGVS